MTDTLAIALLDSSNEAEVDAVAALEAASFSNPWTRDMLMAEVRQPGVARVYVMRSGEGAVVAFCACWLIFDELHINTIAVDPARRQQGLGTRLMRHIFQDAAQTGARRATLEVRRSNTPALRMYERLGFAVQAVRPRYYSNPEEDALILWHEGIPTAPEP